MKHLLPLILSLVLAPGLHGQETTDVPEPNVIRWTTASEQNVFGYDVYRGLSESGPFTRMTPEVIRGAITTDIPRRYEFRDTNIAANTVYWYYVESISLDGSRKRITPIYHSEPKPATPARGQ